MSARLTIVLDDESLYREMKVRAAEEGIPLKVLIERATRAYLSKRDRKPPKFTWEKWDEWQREAAELNKLFPNEGPNDLSDVKHHLYGWPKGGLAAAEERGEYDAR